MMNQYLPPYYDNVVEMQQIMATEDVEIKLAFDTYNNVFNAFFVRKTNPETIGAWEEQFSVNLANMTFEEKKREIPSLLLGFTKLTCSGIENIILTKTTYKSLVDVENSKIVINFVDVGYPNEAMMQEVINYIEALKPAHLGIEIILMFRNHDKIKQNTHAQLTTYTHAQIKTRKEDL